MLHRLSRYRKQALRIGQIVLVLFSFIFLGIAIEQNWSEIRSSAVNFDALTFSFAVLILFLAWILLAIPTYVTVRSLADHISFPQALAAFSSSQAMKYLPGGLWALPSRAIIYQHQHQLSVLKSTFAVVWEVLAVLISSMLIGGSGFILFQFSLPSSVRILLFGLLNLGIIAFFVFPPRFLWRSRIDSDRRLVARLATYLDRVSELSSKTAMQSIGFSILFWIVNGAGFYVLLVSVLGSNLPFNWYEATYIYAAAWVVGFLVIVAPAGLGFRESTLVILMASSITQGEAVFIAILARLWWMIAEGLWIVLGMILYRLSYKTV